MEVQVKFDMRKADDVVAYEDAMAGARLRKALIALNQKLHNDSKIGKVSYSVAQFRQMLADALAANDVGLKR